MSRCRFWLADSLRFGGRCLWFTSTCVPLQKVKSAKNAAHSRVGNPTLDVLTECSEEELQRKLLECNLLLDGDEALKKFEKHHISVVKGRIEKAIRRVETRSKIELSAALQAKCFMRVFPSHSRALSLPL